MGKKKTITMDENQQEELNYQTDNKYSSFDLPEEFNLIDQKVETKETEEKPKEQKKVSTKKAAKKVRSNKYNKIKNKIDSQKQYQIDEAVKLLLTVSKEKFDSSVELNLEVKKENLSGELKLPHGNGKEKKIAIFSDEILKQIENKIINFDLLIAKPQDMGKIAKFARVLGPKGLMPNPKNGTITADPEKAVKDLQGKTRYKTEKKAPLIHLTIAKKSFGEEKIKDNLLSVFSSINPRQIKKASISTSMSPGIKLDISSLTV